MFRFGFIKFLLNKIARLIAESTSISTQFTEIKLTELIQPLHMQRYGNVTLLQMVEKLKYATGVYIHRQI